MKKLIVHSSSISKRNRLWWPSVNGQLGTVYPDSSCDVPGVPVVPGTNTLTATYTGPAFTNVPMTATDTSTVVLGDTTYTHDANGNLTGDATFTYQYDLANQLTNVIRKADSVSVLQCRYDAPGRRVEAIRSDGTVDRYVYFPGSFLVLAVLDGSNNPKEFYTRGPDLSGTLDSAGGIGGILACTYSTGKMCCSHADIMGNVHSLSDTSGAVLASFVYTSFGQLSARTDSVLPRYLFSSKEFDRFLSFSYYGYRYYDPKSGRWMTRDPIREDGGLNLYAFCKNTIFQVDYLGLWVKMVYDVEKKTLTAEDVDTEKSITLEKKVFSGNGESCCKKEDQWRYDIGPLPTGKYLIGLSYRHDGVGSGDDNWYKLYGDNGNGGYSYSEIPVQTPKGETVMRGGFNLHTGRRSNGCLTIWSDIPEGTKDYPHSDDYEKLRDLLDSTKPLRYKNSYYSGWLEVR